MTADLPAPQPDDLAATRAQWRRELLARRKHLPPESRAIADRAISLEIEGVLEGVAGVLGFYWPIQSEYDARPVVSRWLAGAAGREAALPVVIRRAAPLIFRRWTAQTPMMSAGFGTSVPVPDERVDPDTLLVPLVGFDGAGYRLGYGGGYYDRTLAARLPRPSTIGIGYAICRLESIVPQSFDLKLDRIVVA
jgi:5-formyltetrahydrofolate cyclo-ligase